MYEVQSTKYLSWRQAYPLVAKFWSKYESLLCTLYLVHCTSIRYSALGVRRSTLEKVSSIKYQDASRGKSRDTRNKTMLWLLKAGSQSVRWSPTSYFCTGRSAFDIGFNSVFRISPARRGGYLVLSIPTHSREPHCPRPSLPPLPGVLYGAERSGWVVSISWGPLRTTILLQSDFHFTCQ